MEERLIILSRESAIKKNATSSKSWLAMWKKKSKAERIILWIMFGIFVIYGLSLLFPIVWALINSFKPTSVFTYDKFSIFFVPTLENYITVFTTLADEGTDIVDSLWNSIWMSTLSTFLGLVASCLTSYVCAKYRFKFSGFIYGAVILIQILPLVGGVSGMYKLIHETLEIGNNPFLIWPIWFGGFGFSFLMLYSAFKSVPWSYAESAFIDGAGHFRVFLKIMLPQIKPVLASLFVVNFINAWNDYMTAHLYMDEYEPLALTVYTVEKRAIMLGMPVYLAVTIISIVPTIILFICFQKTIMENTTTGGLKG